MGAKQRAAQRGKTKKAAQGSMKGQPRSQKQLNQSIFVPELDPPSRSRSLQAWRKYAQNQSPGQHHGFSMAEEARHTDRRHQWAETSLRSQAITFVSAGNLKREEDAWNTVSEEDSPQKQSEAEPPASPHNEPEQSSLSHAEPVEPQRKAEDKAVQLVEENTLSPDSDSEEEIVFVGRTGTIDQQTRKATPSLTSHPPRAAHVDDAPANEEDEAQQNPLTATAVANDVKALPKFSTSTPIGLDSPMDTTSIPAKKRRSKLSFGRNYNEDELMQDYIDNMALGDTSEEADEDPAQQTTRRKPFKKTETIRLFNGDGLENEKVRTNGKKKAPAHPTVQAIDWNSDDLADFDDLSTTDEEIDDVQQILRHRSRRSGPQYLVVAAGLEASDAKWILQTKLVSKSASKEIEIYEEIRAMNIEESDLDEDSEDDDDETDEEEEGLQDLIDHIESEDDENARIVRYTSQMTDEQIARMLAKQEELGLGGDEMVLFDGDINNQEDSLEDPFGTNDDFVAFDVAKHTSNRGRSKRNKKKQRDSFPPAEAFADALDQDPYGAFDIMDFDRPSLRPKKKGRKSDFPWDLGDLDDDLRDQLVNTWTKDREKKAERKRQREEARLMATLDAEEGSDPSIIKARIRQFLVQEVDVLKLSPMDAHVRAGVHRLAKALKLNSRSEGVEGVGVGRYPVLTKTPRTPCFSIDTIWEVDNLMNMKKYLSRSSYKTPKKGGHSTGVGRGRRAGGGGVTAGVTYRDGDVVGGSAPELGADNRGRALLEKMGWSVGMAIGAEGNKGSLRHVEHIVKTSKSGLG